MKFSFNHACFLNDAATKKFLFNRKLVFKMMWSQVTSHRTEDCSPRMTLSQVNSRRTTKTLYIRSHTRLGFPETFCLRAAVHLTRKSSRNHTIHQKNLRKITHTLKELSRNPTYYHETQDTFRKFTKYVYRP